MRAFVIVLVSSTAAFAGGFDRFERDETLLFDAAGTVVDMSGGYATAVGSYDRVDGRAEHVDIGRGTWSGALRLKVSPAPALSCLASLTQPFATELKFGDDWSHADLVEAQHLRVTELGASCAYGLSVASGTLAPLGGFAYDRLDFRQDRKFPDGAVGTSLDLEGETFTWRAGLAYRHTATGVQASVVYYSATVFDVTGSLRTPIALPNGEALAAPVHGRAAFPQSVRLDVAVPLSPDWLLAMAGQWSDWSSLDHVALQADGSTAFWNSGDQLVDLKTYFRDGLTASVLLGQAWSPEMATWLRLSWDRATTTGWSEHSESWSLQLGARYKLTEHAEIKAAITGIWLQDATLDRRADGAPYAADYSGGLMFVPQLGFTSRF